MNIAFAACFVCAFPFCDQSISTYHQHIPSYAHIIFVLPNNFFPFSYQAAAKAKAEEKAAERAAKEKVCRTESQISI